MPTSFLSNRFPSRAARRVASAALLAALAHGVALRGQTVTFSAAVAVSPSSSTTLTYPLFPVNLATNGTFTGAASTDNTLVTSVGFQITVNPTALTLTFDSLQLATAPFTISRTSTITVGFGQTKTFTETYAVNPIRWTLSDSHVETLTPAQDGNYNIVASFYSPPLVYDIADAYISGSALATGTYSIQGPTETVSGSFSQTLTAAAHLPFSAVYLPTILDTSNYPHSLDLGAVGDHFWFSFVSGTLPISTTVDGVSIQTGLGSAGSAFNQFLQAIVYTSNSTTPISLYQGSLAPLTLVPEPASAALVAGSSGLAVAWFFRRRRLTKVKSELAV